MKRILALVLVAMAMLCFGTIASAESVSPRQSDYFNSYGIGLSATGSGKINITFSCSSAGEASQLGVSTYSVHRYDDGNWTLVAGPLNGSSGYNVSSYAFAKTFQGVKGEKYKVTCSFLCTKNNSTESKAYTSRTVTAK